MATAEWFWGEGGWASRHVDRFPRRDWPGFEAEFWEELRHLITTTGATEDVADEASHRLFLTPPEYVSDHPGAIKLQIRAVHRERAAKAPTPGIAPPEEDTSAFNAAAAEHWASLTDDERDAWRDLVRKRCSFLARSGKALDLMASAWSYDPSWIISLPPKHEPAPPRGPRRVFDALPAPSPIPKG